MRLAFKVQANPDNIWVSFVRQKSNLRSWLEPGRQGDDLQDAYTNG